MTLMNAYYPSLISLSQYKQCSIYGRIEAVDAPNKRATVNWITNVGFQAGIDSVKWREYRVLQKVSGLPSDDPQINWQAMMITCQKEAGELSSSEEDEMEIESEGQSEEEEEEDEDFDGVDENDATDEEESALPPETQPPREIDVASIKWFIFESSFDLNCVGNFLNYVHCVAIDNCPTRW